ncbi:acetyltransferase [Andreprevotia chitinilytica]|uniref:acetyltransferase n=1 Tax=Andreprevotia chitinilytica TaxID=396808 RepID=UPI000558DF6C
MSRLIILGAGGHGKVVADAAELVGHWETVAFLDDRYPELTKIMHWPVLGRLEDVLTQANSNTEFLVAIGNNRVRLDWCRQILVAGARLASVIHPRANVSRYAQLGAGTVCFAGAVVNIAAKLGVGCIVNSNGCVEHDCVLGDAVHICPHSALAGGVTVGQASTVGIGSSVRQLIEIGTDVVIGAGSVVVSNIGSGLTIMGAPAEPRKPQTN